MLREEWAQERIEREIAASKLIPTGITYLDDAMGGFLPYDLMLVTARTGQGKTEFGVSLALEASKAGKSVCYYALEADKWELHRRLKYRKLRQLYFEHFGNQARVEGFPLYREWTLGRDGKDWHALEQVADEELTQEGLGLTIRYEGSKFTAQKFVSELSALKANDFDLVVIDHLHYFELGATSETEGLKSAIHAIRDASIHHGIPIVLLAHLRKGVKAATKTLPEPEDVHGHSDIVKVAPWVLILSKMPQNQLVTDTTATYVHLAKARHGGYLSAYSGVLNWDHRTATYGKQYYLAKTRISEDPEIITDYSQIPRWAKHAIIPATTPYTYGDKHG